MTREERLNYCTVCKLKEFDPKSGTICSLTGHVATFKKTCPDYDEDEKAKLAERKRVYNRDSELKKTINYGRYALLFLGLVHLIYGFILLFDRSSDNTLETFIYLSIGTIFLLLSNWSYKETVLSYRLGLILYISILLIHGFINPASLANGLYGEFFTICIIVGAIMDVKYREKINKA